MPYIKKEDRPKIDEIVNKLIEHLKGVPVEEQDGQLNYIITKILKNVYPERYFHYNRALGMLEAVKQEYYRRVVAPYEDKKMSETGDVE